MFVLCIFLFFWLSVSSVSSVVQSCPTHCNPMRYTIHGILQARILEWVAVPFSRWSSQLRDQSQVVPTASRFSISWATREALYAECSSVSQLCPILCDLMDCNMPGLPVYHQLLEFTQTHVHWVRDAIQPLILWEYHAKCWARWSTSWNQDCQEKCSVTSDMWMIPSLQQKVKRTKEPLDEGKRGEWKSWLETQHSKN